MWKRKRTVIAGRISEDDWVIVRGDQAVGRVHRSPATGVAPFSWFTWTYPCDRGYACNLHDGLRQAREAIRSKWPDDQARVPTAVPGERAVTG